MRRTLAVALLLAPLVWGCTHDYAALETGDAGCPTGNETCGCYPNSTCATGLICASDLCVRMPGSGTGGDIGSGGAIGSGGIVGSGGATGSGGVVGSGGIVGSGGAGGVHGTGGVTSTGGAVGTGGIASTGGAVGTGGVVATGGVTGTGGTVPTTNNQILNGDFSDGSTYWGITIRSSAATGVTSSVSNGQLCVYVPTYVAITIGWPATGSPVAALQAGATYQLSYQMSVSASFYDYEVKVGQATSPYTQTDYITSSDDPVPLAGLQTFTHTFVASPGDAVAGIAFNILAYNSVTVCLDNVSLGTAN